MNLDLTLILPDLNRNKAYVDDKRRFKISINGALRFVLIRQSGRMANIKVNQGDEIMVSKHYGTMRADSVFRYVMGEQIGFLRNQQGKIKNFLAEFQEDVLFVYDDNDFNSVESIIAE
jgi:translation initiation factor IF-1